MKKRKVKGVVQIQANKTDKPRAGKFTRSHQIALERQDPGPCYRLCKVCKTKFQMIERDQAWCSEDCHAVLDAKWARLEEIRKWKESH